MFFILLFILDFNRCYGREDCEECKGLCFGYFMKFYDLWEYVFNGGKMLFEFLFEVLLKEFNCYYVIFDDSRLNNIVKEVLLLVDEIKMWFEYLGIVRENRKKGL